MRRMALKVWNPGFGSSFRYSRHAATLAVIVKTRPNGMVRVRLIHDLRRSGANTLIRHYSERIVLPRLRDALWGHRRPVTAEVVLGDGSTTTVVVEAGEDPTAVVAAACREYDIAPHDCATLEDWLAARAMWNVMCESN